MRLKITIKILFSMFIFTFLFLLVSYTSIPVEASSAPLPYEPEIKLTSGYTEDGTALREFPFKKESNQSFNDYIKSEVNYLVDVHAIPSWHLKYLDDEGYQMYYYKMVHLSDIRGSDKNGASTWGYYDWKLVTEQRMVEISSWYRNRETEVFKNVINGLDIDITMLDPNEILALYWDSYAFDKKNNAYLYLVWTSKYLPSEFVNILDLLDGDNGYTLYKSQKKDLANATWNDSYYYHLKEQDLTIWVTPIVSIEDGSKKGIPLKQSYTFKKLIYGIDKEQFSSDYDPDNLFSGLIQSEVTFDFGVTPQNDGNNLLKMVTHAYLYVNDIEAQSVYSLSFGGYMHYVHFNLDINPEKIYRVDVKYTITNDNKDWYQFWLSEDEHTILKSLTPDKTRGGFLGLHHYQGFKEGSFSSVNNPDKKYKYELLLDYDDQGWLWKIFTGQEYKESDYKRIGDFEILRINYLLDEKVYDVKVKMDSISGDTYNILSPNLIEDESSVIHNVKTWTNDVIETVKSGFSKYKLIFFIILGVLGGLFILWFILKIRKIFKKVLED